MVLMKLPHSYKITYIHTKGTIDGDTCVGDLQNFPACWRVAMPYINSQGPSPSLEKEGPPTLRSTTPGSLVFSSSLQHRVIISKADIGGICTVQHRGKPNDKDKNPVIFGLYHEQLWESAKLMQNQNKEKPPLKILS